MKMKIVATAFFVASAVFAEALPGYWLFFLVAVFVFAAYRIWRPVASSVNPLNDLPNAFRVFLASLGGLFITMDSTFILPSAGVLLYAGSLFLNDEYQRRTLFSITHGIRGGSIALLGIDGSGKSSHAEASGDWLRKRGYTVTVMPFHRYLFVERLASLSRVTGGRGGGSNAGGPRRTRRNPIRPLLSLADNLILQILSSIGSRAEGRVVIYDRFIWSTFIKYEALGYPVEPLSFIYLLPRPLTAIVLDVPVEKSLKVIDERGASHIHYPADVLQSERASYLAIARRNGYPVIDSTAAFADVQRAIESHLARLFPAVAGAGSA